MKPLIRLLLALTLWIGVALPAHAAVTITFWSHELGNSFPHAFFTLRGTVDATGAPVDANFGFTPKSISPAMLFGPVPGRLDIAKPFYIAGSDAQFSIVLTDAQYGDILALAAAWDENGGDNIYRLGDRNCVSFVKEAARRIGLIGLDHPGLMKKPRSYLKAVAAANAGHITVIDQHGKTYLASLAPLATAPPVASPSVTPSVMATMASPPLTATRP